ncbi:SDR family oxidoreductase [Pedobacter gandavensis]|uniref:dTDP-4-dehydrorhamnose reductase family protein n=1 Tax=Pedobacter gandavensis TaxID=2679963 RepID=UPI0024784D29|nr:SDR family oxidoreductase [Pedobacter gandavensis]WGQ07509.1 SDR family oxidoreductase [Pedobacter gandavensis]
MKILIIGSKGMAGHVIYNFFKENTDFNVVDIARGEDSHIPSHQFDVTDFNKLRDVLKLEKPEIVVNCIGILNKDAEDNPDKAILLNCYLPHFLAKLGDEQGFRLIHISTDCVFSGKTGSYTESSVKDGIGFYAQTKALGEVVYGNHLTLRTSIIGPELKSNGIGLFHWFMQQKGEIKGYRRAFWTGITTIELAKIIKSAIDQNIYGLHHLVNDNKVSKFDLLNLFVDVFERTGLSIKPSDEYEVDKSLLRTNELFNYQVPSYKFMIEEMKVWILNNENLYSHYDLR